MVDIRGRGGSSNIEDRRGKGRQYNLPSPPRPQDYPNTPQGQLDFDLADAKWRGQLLDAMNGYSPGVETDRRAWLERKQGSGNAIDLGPPNDYDYRDQFRARETLTGSGSNDTLRGGTADKRVIDTIIAEALGEGEAGMTAVAFTILNRANNRGLTPLQVVKQPNQFSGYSNPGSAVKRAMSDPNVRARVEAIWNQASTGSVPDPTSGGEYFHTTSISPGWSKGVNKHGTTTIGNHVFYKGKAPTVTAAVSPDVPGRRPETALSAIDKALGRDMGVSGLGYAPPSQSLPSLAASPPRISEEALTKWVQGGNFTPAPRNTGLTTRKVQAIPLTPDSPLAGNVPDLQTELNRVAQQRREAYAPSQPPGSVRGAVNALTTVPGALEVAQAAFVPRNLPPQPRVVDGRGTDRRVADQRAEQLRMRPAASPSQLGKLPMSTATLDWMTNNAIPRGPGGRGRPTSLPPLTGRAGNNQFAGTIDRLGAAPNTAVAAIEEATNPYGGSPVFGDNPNLTRLVPGSPLAPAGLPPLPGASPKPSKATIDRYVNAARLGSMGGMLPPDTMLGWIPGVNKMLEDEALQTANAFGYGDADGKTRLQKKGGNFRLSDLGNSFFERMAGRFNTRQILKANERGVRKGLGAMLGNPGMGPVAGIMRSRMSPSIPDLARYAGANGWVNDPGSIDDRHLEFIRPRH